MNYPGFFPVNLVCVIEGRGRGKLVAAMVIRDRKQFPDHYVISPLYFFNVMKFLLRFSRT